MSQPTDDAPPPPNRVHHLLQIAATPGVVFDAVAIPERLAGWWTTEVHGEPAAPGARLQLFFGPFTPELEIVALEAPTGITWEGRGGHDPWGQRTTIHFNLTDAPGGTRVSFWHMLGEERDSATVGTANFTWGYYLNSLRRLCETGRGTPFDADTPGARVGADPLPRTQQP